MIYLGGIRKVKDVIILGLRAFYKNPDNYKHLLPPQITANAFSGMSIYDSYAQTLKNFPMIVLYGGSGRMISGGIGNSFASELYDDNGDLEGYLYGGMYEFSIDIELGAKTTLEREVLRDLTTSALRWSLRRKLEFNGIIIKDVSYSGENKIQYDTDYIYTANINVQTFSEWYEAYKLLPIADIEVEQTIKPFNQQTQSEYKSNDVDIDLRDINTKIYDITSNKQIY